jgi:WD40 repeat protein
VIRNGGDVKRCLTTNGAKLLIGCEQGSVRIFDLLAAKELRCLQVPDKGNNVSSIGVTQKGELFVTGSESGCITLWAARK